jgi:NADH:ubiquinone oxidoreductase subunit 6 (subunit J)
VLPFELLSVLLLAALIAALAISRARADGDDS